MKNPLLLVLVAAIAAAATWKLKSQKEEAPPVPPLVNVSEMGSLVSLRVNYANVIEFNERVTQGIPWTQWELRFGGTRVLLVARGECLMGTDLKLARYEQSTAATKTATLVLKPPTVISARLNHDSKRGGSYFYAVSTSGIVAFVPGSEQQTKAMNRALEKGQQDIEASCARPEFVDAARKSAEAVLLPAVSATGWKIAIAWRQ